MQSEHRVDRLPGTDRCGIASPRSRSTFPRRFGSKRPQFGCEGNQSAQGETYAVDSAPQVGAISQLQVGFLGLFSSPVRHNARNVNQPPRSTLQR